MIQKFEFKELEMKGAYEITPFYVTDERGGFVKDLISQARTRRLSIFPSSLAMAVSCWKNPLSATRVVESSMAKEMPVLAMMIQTWVSYGLLTRLVVSKT